VDAGAVLKIIHAVLGVGLVVGLVGRWMTLAQAARTGEIAAVHTLLGLSDRFEKLVIRSSVLVLVFGVATAIAQGRPFLGPLQGQPIDWLFVSVVLFLSVIPLIPLVFLPRGRVFAAALEDATARGTVTPALTAAFRDRTVFIAHAYELGVILVVFTLMITKPF
jgi:hypothetical protein